MLLSLRDSVVVSSARVECAVNPPPTRLSVSLFIFHILLDSSYGDVPCDSFGPTSLTDPLAKSVIHQLVDIDPLIE